MSFFGKKKPSGGLSGAFGGIAGGIAGGIGGAVGGVVDTGVNVVNKTTGALVKILTHEEAIGLQILFGKPLEPAFQGNALGAFDFPGEYYTARYKTIAGSVINRIAGLFGFSDSTTKIRLKEIPIPDLSFANEIPIDGCFSLFNEFHLEVAGKLIDLFMKQPDSGSFISCCAYAKDRVNPYLFQYCLSVATAHRLDTKTQPIPTAIALFPDQFVDPGVFRKAREEGTLVPPESRQPVEIPFNYTASDLEEEQRLAYFREDIGVNMHHWHWHLVYPGFGPPEIVNKDRRGELFYYMHSQILARYNMERFSQGLPAVVPMLNLRDVIPEAYFPKIVRSSNNRAYPPRFAKQVLLDLNRDKLKTKVADLEGWRDKIYEAVDQGFIIGKNGERIELNETTGVDILGDLVEPSSKSVNRDLYGSLHNGGHSHLAYIHDPEKRHLEDYGVMGDVATAMRDPAFYKWHAFIDSIFVRHKMRLPEYNNSQLNYNAVQVQSINVQVTGKDTPANNLLTYWQKSQVDLSAGLDFGPEGNVFAAFTHLQHAPFTYKIDVNNISSSIVRGTCRIFLGPKTDERGNILNFKAQQRLMAELDKFTVTLNPGSNKIVRRSDESSVTIPFERTFRQVGKSVQPGDPKEKAQFQFCGCGWPHHMFIPRGQVGGMGFDLFVMISNITDDLVDQPEDDNPCNDAVSFCGKKDAKYPDHRSMGYPFDRQHSANTLADFIANRSNMRVQQLQISFSNSIINKS